MKKPFLMGWMEDKFDWYLVLAAALYIAGIFFAPKNNISHLENMGIAKQEEYYYTDSNGDDHEGISPIRIEGLGNIFTYIDLYAFVVVNLVVAYCAGSFVMNKIDYGGMMGVIIGNASIGGMLIRLCDRQSFVSTILFCLGVITSFFWIYDKHVIEKKKKEEIERIRNEKHNETERRLREKISSYEDDIFDLEEECSQLKDELEQYKKQN